MRLVRLSYKEFPDSELSWELSPCDFQKINLIVGRNSTGKSRVLHTINGLAKLVLGEVQELFASAMWDVVFSDESGSLFEYRLYISDKKVIEESLARNGLRLLSRSDNVGGMIWFEEQQRFIGFSIPDDKVAANYKVDDLQHPFLTPLKQWASKVELHLFGSDYGRQNVITIDQLPKILETVDHDVRAEPAIFTYCKGYHVFGQAFDDAIMRDMSALGYDLIDVGARKLELNVPEFASPLFGLFIKERGSTAVVEQGAMSQGLFRALALTIHLNYLEMRGCNKLLLIDDVGEGLDYERSLGMINVLMGKASKSNSQVLMTSNDKFVMNEVPLDYWIVLRRASGLVSGYNSSNAKDKFEEFKFMGLNNFDFFSSDLI